MKYSELGFSLATKKVGLEQPPFPIPCIEALPSLSSLHEPFFL